MRLTTIALTLFASCALFAQTAPPPPAKPAAPVAITDTAKLAIAKTQRDLVVADSKMKRAIEQYNAAKGEAEAAQKVLAGQTAEASKSCSKEETFDGGIEGTLTCVPKPAQQ